MNEKRKSILSSIAQSLLLLFIGGIALFILILLGSFGAFPLYVTRVIPVLGIPGILALVLTICWDLPPRWGKGIGIAFLCLLGCCAVYVGHGAYKDSIPTLDDRDALLYQYEPFRSGSKAVVLDEAPSLQFDRKTANNIRLDGATALYPVYASFVQNVWPAGTDASRYSTEGYGAVACSGTIDAYTRLVKGEADMIFAAAPSEAQIEAARNAGVEFHLTPIGREAFVFFVNSKNPVEDLTVEQIQGIYTGEITNWKEVGGKNQSIRPFQRAENSGSQSALLRLMEGLPLMEPETEDRIAGMGGIINEVASYRNYKNAIGFSFRYYSTEMVQNGHIKLLSLNGVEPTRETIRDGSYPISSYFYAVTASPIGESAPEENNPDLAAFLEWILSPQGQAIIEKVGYVSLFS